MGIIEKNIADNLERHLTQEMKARLVNWGAWWRIGNSLEIRRASGQITQSPSYRLMQYGRVQMSGYANPHVTPVNDTDALELHQRIVSELAPGEVAELRRFYSDGMGSGTGAQRTARHRAVRKLIGGL